MAKKTLSFADFSGGLNSFDLPWEIKDNQTPMMRNADFARRGMVEKRKGWDAVEDLGLKKGIRGIVRFLRTGTNAKDALVIFCGRKIFVWEWGENPVELGEYPGLAEGEEPTEIVRGGMFQSREMMFGDGKHTTCVLRWNDSLETPAWEMEETGAPASNIFLFDGVMILAVDAEAPTVLRWNHPNEILVWDPEAVVGGGESMAGSIQIGGEGKPIGGLVMFQGEPFAFTTNEKFRVVRQIDQQNLWVGYSAAETEDFSDGAVASGTVKNIENGIWHFGNGGFATFGVFENFPDYRTSKDFDFAIRNLVAVIEKKNFAKMDSVVWKKQYWNACCFGNGNANNAILVFDKFYSSWKLYDYPVAQWVVWNDEFGNDALFFGHSSDSVIGKISDTHFVDGKGKFNDRINFYWESKKMRMGVVGQFANIIFEGFAKKNCSTEIEIFAGQVSTKWKINDDEFKEELLQNSTLGVSGDFVSGSLVVGEGNPQPLYRYRKILKIPVSQNETDMFWFTVKNFGENEPFSLLYTFVEAESKKNVK